MELSGVLKPSFFKLNEVLFCLHGPFIMQDKGWMTDELLANWMMYFLGKVTSAISAGIPY